MRLLSSVPRRWLIAGAVVLGGLFLVAFSLGVIYPRVGAWMIKDKVGGKLAKKLGRDITFGDIDVSLGRAVLTDVQIRGPLDGNTPLIHIDRIDVEFDTLASFTGTVKVGEAKLDGVMVTLRRDAFGRDNVRDIIERRNQRTSGSGGKDSTLGKMRPTKLTVKRIKLLADDAMTGTTALMGDGDATWTPEGLVAHARELTATTPGAPKASVKAIEVRKMDGVSPIVTVDGGEIALWPKMALSGIAGKIVEDPKQKGHFILDFAGGYGGVPGRLWTANGGFDPRAGTAAIDLVAAKFALERLAPILASSPVVDYKSTAVDTELHVAVDAKGATFSGEFNLTGLNVGHPMIADKEVHDLDLSANVAGSFDRATRTLQFTRGDFVARDVPFSITGMVVSPRRDVVIPEVPQGPVAVDNDDPPSKIDPQTKAVPMRGPRGIQVLKLRMVIPKIKCQKVLDAIPAEMAPHMQGYKLKGDFTTDINLEIDWTNLDALVLGGHVGIRQCKVVEEPEDSPKRLEKEFEHFVEYEQDEWMSFIVGPENPDFVPIDQINVNLIKSIMTTEDAAFYKHRGFITTEFRTALISDLKARAFRHGASSITMQMVKNVLLFREKTLARKLQELFLTWHVENTLEKDRILEIYFNVIEYGPALYGIGPAMKHYFGKHPRDMNLVEAAFFSSILPNPKARYKQYCQGTLTKWTTAKIERILALMLKRERITQEEYYRAMSTPLVFMKDGTETEKQCMDRVKKALKNARPTNPLKK
ncbi:MAG TPA: transglycosylase domain-containing protein [Kofleriaceae bacterium]